MKPRLGVSRNVYKFICEELSLSPLEVFIKTSLGHIASILCISSPQKLSHTNFQECFKTKLFIPVHPGGE